MTTGQFPWRWTLISQSRRRVCMESQLHLRMKDRVSRELEVEGYTVFYEPSFPPSRFLTWSSYRPDILGVRTGAAGQEYVFVECETRPSGRRIAGKNFASVDVQARLNSDVSLRRILVVPRGKLRGVDRATRRSWETWIYCESSLERFPRGG